MSLLQTALVVVGAWLVAAVVVGVLVGRAIRLRDLRATTLPGPQPAPAPPEPEPAELQRLLADLERPAGTTGEVRDVTDLLRIWSVRSTSGPEGPELDRAIEAARRNGHPWDSIQAVLELPASGTSDTGDG